MKKYFLVLIASACTLLFSCSKLQLPEGDGTDCISFQKKANTIEDIVVGQYNSVQSVFYHVGGWAWNCCFNTRSGLKEGDSLKICGYVIKEISKSGNSDYYINFCTNDYDLWREKNLDTYLRSVLYKICDKSQDIAPYIIVGVDTTKVHKDIINKVVGEKNKKLFFNGECILLYVADTLFDSEIAPGYNESLSRFAVPYIVVSDSNDIEIRKGE
ncbi:MAG: hypothetical protein K6C07_08935 [Bacteroidales bacterium]|nr:hypothetical protein [Bacteroidales bacterium]